jgi:hypothetical protein
MAGTKTGSVRLPGAHEVWNAFVPFETAETEDETEDETEEEGKDRPVLVLSADTEAAEVLRITSQEQRDGYLPLPLERCRGVLSKESWLHLEPTRVPLEDFRSYRGLCPPWIWAELRTRGLTPPHRPAPVVRQRPFLERIRKPVSRSDTSQRP